jgi:hypothetical protein
LHHPRTGAAAVALRQLTLPDAAPEFKYDNWMTARHREADMISLEDCLAFCGLSEAEVQAIAEHEHIPEIAAAGLAQYLMCREGGTVRIRDMILDDIVAARARHDDAHARELVMVLRHFLAEHPEVEHRTA